MVPWIAVSSLMEAFRTLIFTLNYKADQLSVSHSYDLKTFCFIALCLSSLSSWLPLLYCFPSILPSRYLICVLSPFTTILNYHCHLSCFLVSSILSPLSLISTHRLLLRHVEPFSRSSFNRLSVDAPASLSSPQYRRLHPHRVFLLL